MSTHASPGGMAYEVSGIFRAPPERLFGALTDAATLKTIWGVSDITVDARPNGRARAHLQIGGENWDFTLTYREVVPAERLSWVVHFDRFPKKEIRVAVRFRKTAGGSEVVVRMENFDSAEERDANRGAWEAALETLERLIG